MFADFRFEERQLVSLWEGKNAKYCVVCNSLQVLGMDKNFLDRVCGLGRETWNGCEWVELLVKLPGLLTELLYQGHAEVTVWGVTSRYFVEAVGNFCPTVEVEHRKHCLSANFDAVSVIMVPCSHLEVFWHIIGEHKHE